MRIGFLGMDSLFSVRPLEALLEAGLDVRFVMKPKGGVETRTEPSLEEERGARFFSGDVAREVRDPFRIARRERIPRYLVGDASAAPALALFREKRIDALVVCFFNQLLAEEVFAPLSLGAINAHPSLLPRWRGPSPLFWMFREGDDEGGVTVHRIDVGEDSGDVLAQRALAVGHGVRGEDYVDTLSRVAAVEVCAALSDLAAGRSAPRAQGEEGALRAPRPRAIDRELSFLIASGASAEQVFRFVRGVGRWVRLTYRSGGLDLRVVDAAGFEPESRVPGAHVLVGDRLIVACGKGAVVLEIAS